MANVVEIILKSIDRTRDGFTGAIRNADDFKKRIGQMGPVMAAAATAAVAGIGAIVRRQIDLADETGKTSQAIGISTEALSSLRHAADLSGVSNEGLTVNLRTFSRAIDEAASGSASQVEMFRRLRISITDTNGKIKATPELLKEVADKFAQARDGASKAALAQELFGRSGLQMIPLLNQGSKGLSDMAAEARNLGLVISDDAAKRSEEFNDNLTRLKLTLTGSANVVMQQVVPAMAAFSSGLAKSSQESEHATRAGHSLANIFKVVLAVAVAVHNAFRQIANVLGGILVSALEIAAIKFNFFNDIFGTITTAVASGINLFKEWIKTIATAGSAIVAFAKGDITEAARLSSEAWDKFKSNSGEGVKIVTDSMRGGFEAARQGVISTITAIRSNANETWQAMQEDADAFAQRMLRITNPELFPSPDSPGSKGEAFDVGEKRVGSDKSVESQIKNMEQLAALQARLREEALRGDTAKIESERNRFTEQLRNIARLSNDEEASLELSRQAWKNHQLRLTEITQEGERERARLIQTLREAGASTEMDRARLQADSEYQQRLFDIERLGLADEEARNAKLLAEQIHSAALTQIHAQRAAVVGQFFGSLASLAQAFGKKGLAFYKTFAIAESIISTYSAVAGALAFRPWTPMNFVYAAISLARGLAAVAQIRKVGSAHAGLGYVPEESTYILRRGERVLSPTQNRDVTEMAESFNSGSTRNSGGLMNVILNVDGEEFARGVARMFRDGRLTA